MPATCFAFCAAVSIHLIHQHRPKKKHTLHSHKSKVQEAGVEGGRGGKHTSNLNTINKLITHSPINSLCGVLHSFRNYFPESGGCAECPWGEGGACRDAGSDLSKFDEERHFLFI
jgi:hypothetical protein